MQKNKTEILIQKYLSHQLNEQEFEELKQWIAKDASHREIFVKLLSLHHVNNQLNLLHQFDKEGSWKSLQNRCNQSGSIYRRIVVYSSAAAIAILIGITSIVDTTSIDFPLAVIKWNYRLVCLYPGGFRSFWILGKR